MSPKNALLKYYAQPEYDDYFDDFNKNGNFDFFNFANILIFL
jgi:hypothetical protein